MSATKPSPTAETPVPDATLTTAERTALVEAAKVRQGATARASWRVSADKLHQNLRHCAPDKKEIIHWAFLWCIDRNIFLDDFAHQVGYDSKTIDKIITGAYRDPRSGELYDIPDKLADSIRRWRKDQQRAAQLGEIDFVVTPTVNRIWTGCDLARESHTPVFIYGASHLGKTWALEHYAVANNHGSTPLVRIPSSSGMGGMIRAIAEQVGVSPNGNVADLKERIKRGLTKNQVLILDEVHQLIYTYRKESFFACLEVIREIYDHAKCGIVICTTNVFRARIEEERKAALEQLFRRGVHRVQLGDIVLAKDAKMILAHHGLEWPDKRLAFEFTGTFGTLTEKPLEILRQLAREEGLKAITERIRYARKFASKARGPLDWKHFVQAHLTIASNAAEPADDWE
jgi:DNA transposition AAA+ family ATPase